MAKFVLLYTGGSMPESDEEGAKVMAEWQSWFSRLGAAVDDIGNRFGASASVGQGATTGATGYSVISAESLAAAQELVRDNPQLAAGGGVEIHETVAM